VSTLQSDVSTLQSDVSTLQSDVLSIQSDIAELQKANPYALFRVAPGPNINATNPTVMPFTITSHQDTNTFTLLGSGRFRCDRAGTYLIHGGLSYQSLDPYVGLSLRISKVVPTPAVAYLGGAESLVAGGLAPISSSRFIRVIECALNDEFEASTLRHASASGAAYSVGTNTHFGFIRLGDNR
jgi:hypothetical protein